MPWNSSLKNTLFNNKHGGSGFPHQFPPALPVNTEVKTSPSTVAGSAAATMRLRGEPQVFVSVAYDFEYLAEDGKRVFMKESEILLLINKTNHDWWQVRTINFSYKAQP